MADNTLQFDWIALLKWNAEAYLRDDPAAFVAGDHLIYPVEGDADERQAPDVYVAFGRPKGYRGSYKVWEEGGVFPQVIFEVWSPNNRQGKMEDKRRFYERYGVEEYYIVYPDFPMFVEGWRRVAGNLEKIGEEQMADFTSPRLGLRFHMVKGQLTVYGPDGRELKKPDEIILERNAAERELAAAERERAAAADKAAKLAAKLRELGIDPDAV
jgi:Uma2 family endonuclease